MDAEGLLPWPNSHPW